MHRRFKKHLLLSSYLFHFIVYNEIEQNKKKSNLN